MKKAKNEIQKKLSLAKTNKNNALQEALRKNLSRRKESESISK